MRIAHLSPLFESIPPQLYGGTERIVSYLTEEQVRQGHEVTLFASGDSRTHAHLESQTPGSLRLNFECHDHLTYHILECENVFREADRFDIVHSHIDYLFFPFARRLPVPSLTTLHGRLDYPELNVLYGAYSDIPVVSISHSQRRPLTNAFWFGNVYHGLPQDILRLDAGSGGYLAFLGRISPEKAPDAAIRIAAAAGLPLKIAAKVDDKDREYFEAEIRPLLSQAHVEFIGEINDEQKQDFLGNALALVFPINWDEPFGLVMIEAMACGTPVIALRRGSVPEVLEDGITGFVCKDEKEAVVAVRRVRALDRRACRAQFEKRFTARRMAEEYEALYEKLLQGGVPEPPESLMRWKRQSII